MMIIVKLMLLTEREWNDAVRSCYQIRVILVQEPGRIKLLGALPERGVVVDSPNIGKHHCALWNEELTEIDVLTHPG